MTKLFGDRILILVPHPDDEVVACAATIGRAQAEGAQIFAAYLTHGCVAHNSLWPWQRQGHSARLTQRHHEALRVAEKLGITPIAWSEHPARSLWRQLPQVKQDVLALVERYQIDQLWVPAYEGGNADHDGLNALGAALAGLLSVLEFAEYNWLNGITQNNHFPYPTAETITLELTLAEQAAKTALLKLYASERGNLFYITPERESFRPIVEYDYQQPPHPGLLWYQRFQWVPFHHPAIDRTTPAQVSAAIRAAFSA